MGYFYEVWALNLIRLLLQSGAAPLAAMLLDEYWK
jgi:hypothetical protein